MKALIFISIFLSLTGHAKGGESKDDLVFLKEFVKKLKKGVKDESGDKTIKTINKTEFKELLTHSIVLNEFKPKLYCQIKKDNKGSEKDSKGINKYELRLILARLGIEKNDQEDPGLKGESFCISEDIALDYLAKQIWVNAIGYSPEGAYQRDVENIKEIKIKHLIKQIEDRFELVKDSSTKDGSLLIKNFNGYKYYWSLGDKFNSNLRDELTNPASLSISKSAGEDRIASVKLAAKVTIIPIEDKWDWIPSVGYSFEKNSGDDEPIDIRGIYTSITEENCKRALSFDLSRLDNFAEGNETLVARVKYLRSITFGEKKSCDDINKPAPAWNSFPNNSGKFKAHPWRYFFRPGIEMEVNNSQSKTDDPLLMTNDNTTYYIASLNAGLEKGRFEFKYSLNKRFDIDRDQDLTYQEFAVNWYVDKKKRISLGLEATKGRRPIDTDDIEKYEFVIGYRR